MHDPTSHILIVDDDASLRLALATALSGSYVVWEAASGEEACRILRNHPIAAIVLDVVLGHEHGLDLIGRFRPLSQAPIVILTGYSTEDLAIQADVPYLGTIVPRSVDILPASLPYQVVSFLSWDTGLTAETAQLPDQHRYKLEIVPENGGSQEHTLTDLSSFSSFAYSVPAVILSMPSAVLSRVTLSFKGATPSDQTALDAWRNNPNQTMPCSVTVTPSIKVDGVEQTLTSPQQPPPIPTMGLCTTNTTTHRLTLRMTLP